MKKKKTFTLSGRATYFLFTILPVVLYSFFYVVSVINGVRYSFTNWDGISKSYDYIGLKNYRQIFKNPYFWQSLRVTLLYSLMLVVGTMLGSLLLSLALNSLKKSRIGLLYIRDWRIGISMQNAWNFGMIFCKTFTFLGEILWNITVWCILKKSALKKLCFVRTATIE